MIRLLPIEAATCERSPLHGDDRAWQETNCYVDLWIETLHALGLDPVPALTFNLSADFDGEQWQFIKFPLEDLRALYGIDVAEMNPWHGLEFHIQDQLQMGRLLTAEVDSWYLPDTAGVSYGIEHTKTSVVANMIDVEERRLGYFHGAGYYELEGDDYVGLLLRPLDHPEIMQPYVEQIRVDHIDRPDADTLIERVTALARVHLDRRPDSNPVTRLAKRVVDDRVWLQEHGMDMFHGYAFATVRQLGATAELSASLCNWFEENGVATGTAADDFAEVSSLAKTVQFKLARIASGREVELDTLFEQMAARWDSALGSLDDRLG